jgi:hypothetical protein
VAEQPPSEQGKPDDYPEVMYLVCDRRGVNKWVEWEMQYGEIVAAVSDQLADQNVTHPGFDVIEVTITQHVVVRPQVTIVSGAVAGWGPVRQTPASEQVTTPDRKGSSEQVGSDD